MTPEVKARLLDLCWEIEQCTDSIGVFVDEGTSPGESRLLDRCGGAITDAVKEIRRAASQ